MTVKLFAGRGKDAKGRKQAPVEVPSERVGLPPKPAPAPKQPKRGRPRKQ